MLLVAMQAKRADIDSGMVKIQFELNGKQSRLSAWSRSAPLHRTASARQGRPVADALNSLHVAAPRRV